MSPPASSPGPRVTAVGGGGGRAGVRWGGHSRRVLFRVLSAERAAVYPPFTSSHAGGKVSIQSTPDRWSGGGGGSFPGFLFAWGILKSKRGEGRGEDYKTNFDRALVFTFSHPLLYL